MLGPFRGGRVDAVASVPGRPNEFYFGHVNGGVWKTVDAARVWKPIFDSQPVASIGAMAVAPSSPDTIYVGTGESTLRDSVGFGDGVYKSTDAGNTWKHLGLENTQHIGKVAVDPKNANIVFVAAIGHLYAPNPDRGVFRSKDGGATWEKVLFRNNDVGAVNVAIDPVNSQVVVDCLVAAVSGGVAPEPPPGSGGRGGTAQPAQVAQHLHRADYIAGDHLPGWRRVPSRVIVQADRVRPSIGADAAVVARWDVSREVGNHPPVGVRIGRVAEQLSRIGPCDPGACGEGHPRRVQTINVADHQSPERSTALGRGVRSTSDRSRGHCRAQAPICADKPLSTRTHSLAGGRIADSLCIVTSAVGRPRGARCEQDIAGIARRERCSGIQAVSHALRHEHRRIALNEWSDRSVLHHARRRAFPERDRVRL
jgi:hypothetical protein